MNRARALAGAVTRPTDGRRESDADARGYAKVIFSERADRSQTR